MKKSIYCKSSGAEINGGATIQSVEEIIKRINEDKDRVEKDLNKFCRDKAVELLHGCIVNDDKMCLVDIRLSLQILEFLSTL